MLTYLKKDYSTNFLKTEPNPFVERKEVEHLVRWDRKSKGGLRLSRVLKRTVYRHILHNT